MTKPYQTPGLVTLTYAACREIVRGWDNAQLARSLPHYQHGAALPENPAHREEQPGARSRTHIRDHFANMARAIDDEQMSRQYDDAADDPFFEDAVEGYDPGDIVDLTI